MYRVLLVDQDANHAERLASRLRQHGLAVSIAEGIPEARRCLQRRIPPFELVLVVASEMPDRWLGVLRALVQASRQSCMCLGPLFLFVTPTKCNPHMRLRIEHLGARYVHE
jgi:ActR/RegA family two-component response regulator